MKTYELAYSISPQITSEQANDIAKEIEAFIQTKEGVIVSAARISAQTFAYPVNKHASGHVGVVTFQVTEANVKAIQEHLQKTPNVLRQTLLHKKPQKEMKERRTRRPLAANPETPENKDAHKGEKVEIEEMNKKLEEILGE